MIQQEVSRDWEGVQVPLMADLTQAIAEAGRRCGRPGNWAPKLRQDDRDMVELKEQMRRRRVCPRGLERAELSKGI
eukprot:9772261-Lingulodinium_polyedra.AAC.1